MAMKRSPFLTSRESKATPCTVKSALAVPPVAEAIARAGAYAVMPPYPFAAVTTVADAMILACQDHRTAAVLVWFSCWLPRMVQVADPPAPPTRLDR